MFLMNKYSRSTRPTQRAITLIEMLISMAVTLLMMAAVVNLFANIGTGVRNRRASMELGSQLRMARARLFKDLAGATCPARPKLPSDDHDDGYLEIIEGQWSDKNPSGLLLTGGTEGVDRLVRGTSLIPGSNVGPADATDARGLGDYDDILALTVRSESEPFVGQYFDTVTNRTETVESDLAEVIWYAVENPADGSLGEPGMRTVYRRVHLIAPWLADRLEPTTGTPSEAADLLSFHRRNDISVRRVNLSGTTSIWVPNTLSDLTKREHRFAHSLNNNDPPGFGYPYHVDQRAIRATSYNSSPIAAQGPLRPYGEPFDIDPLAESRHGSDVMLNDVLAFDLRVFDPGAPLYSLNGIVLEPSDRGWLDAYESQEQPNATNPFFDAMTGQGAYVDLGYTEASWHATISRIPPNQLPPAPQPIRPMFSGLPNDRSLLNVSAPANPIRSIAYDTWPFHYEDDGLDQDGVFGPDQGTDGIDNNNTDGVDDSLERETAPPYDTPLRGMQVKLRVYDRETRQIREATVTRNFVPQ